MKLIPAQLHTDDRRRLLFAVCAVMAFLCVGSIVFGQSGDITEKFSEEFGFTIPLLYEQRWKLPELTRFQKFQLQTLAKSTMPENTSVWFCLITDSRNDLENDSYFSAVVYFSPHQVETGIYAGKLVRLTMIRTKGPIRLKKENLYERYAYVLPDADEGRKPPELPLVHRLPFVVEGRFSRGDLLDVIHVIWNNTKPSDGSITRIERLEEAVKVVMTSSQKIGASRSKDFVLKTMEGEWKIVQIWGE